MEEHEREQAKIAWLRRYTPIIAAAMAAVTFVIIGLAGHSNGKALLVAAIMFAFVVFTVKLREWFGVNGSIAAMFVLAFLLWQGQRNGWF